MRRLRRQRHWQRRERAVSLALTAMVMFIFAYPSVGLGQLRCLDKSRCGISTDSQLKSCTSNLDCYCAQGDVEKICTGTACSLSIACGQGQVLKDYSCDGVTWRVGGAISTKDCAPEVKSPRTPLSQIIWCCGAPAPTSGTTNGGASTTGGSAGAGSPTGSAGGATPVFFQWLAQNKSIQDFFKSEAAASAAFFAKFSPLVTPKATGPFLVYAHDRDVVSGSGVEVDLLTTSYQQLAPMVTVTLKNNSNQAIALMDLQSSGGFGVIQQGFRKVSMSPGTTTLFQLKLDSASSGVKSAAYTIVYKRGAGPVERFTFTAGGIVWTSLQESKDTAKKRSRCSWGSSSSARSASSAASAATASVFASPAPDPCWRPTRSVNRFFPKMGSEDLALAKATTDQQFIELIPKLQLSSAEELLKNSLPKNDIGNRLFQLVMMTNRVMVSRGAVAGLESWSTKLLIARSASLKAATPSMSQSQIQQAISQEILTAILPIMQGARNDFYGQARSQLILAVANISELKVLVRLTTSVLLARGIEEMAYLNGMGRFFARAALTRAYLSTNPPLEEANQVLSPTLGKVRDLQSRAPLAQTIYSQYPELWVAEHIGGTP